VAVDFRVEMAFGWKYSNAHERQNHCISAEPTADNNENWFTSTGSATVTTDYPTVTGLPGGGFASAREITWVTGATNLSAGQWYRGGQNSIDPFGPGDVMRARFCVRSSKTTTLNVFVQWFTDADVFVSQAPGSLSIPVVANKWTEVVIPARTVPATAGKFLIGIYSGVSQWVAGDKLAVTRLLVERNVSLAPYYSAPFTYKTFPGPPDGSWTDVSEYVTDLGVDRGRNNEFDEVEAGTLNIKLDNADGRFTPERTASPYYPNVVPMVPVRVRATTDNWETFYHVFTGVVEKWPVTLDVLPTCDVTATDLYGLLGRSKLRAPLRERFKASGATQLFPLSEDTGYSDVFAGGADAVKFAGSGGANDPTYDGAAFYRGDGIGTGMTIAPTVSTIGTGLQFTIPGASESGWVGVMWRPDARVTVASGDSQMLINLRYPSAPKQTAGTGTWAPYYIEVQSKWSATANSHVIAASSGNAGNTNTDTGEVPIKAGGAYFITLEWHQDWVGVIGDYMPWTASVYDVSTGTLVGSCTTEFYDFIMPTDNDVVVRIGGTYGGNKMFSGQLANVVVFAEGMASSIPYILTGSDDGTPVSEAEQLNELFTQAGYSYMADRTEAYADLAPLDWTDRKAVLESVQGIGFDANGLMFPGKHGLLEYVPGSVKVGQLYGNTPDALTDKDDFDPGVTVFVDDQNIVNDVTLEFSGGGGLDPATSNAVSPDSIARYETATFSHATNLTVEGDRRSLASWIAYTRGEGGLRIESVTFPLLTATAPAALLAVDIGTRIRLAFPDTAPFTTGDFFVEGLSLDVSPTGSVADSSVTFKLSALKSQTAWLLGDSTFGVLGSTTRLFVG
jgi:hypothetical protein